jgi:hypothetical protein|mmetsp:Transcript_18226/g.26950  ORF Transcript_18226/g.26950 Transcript_18226/m.26950 type:complete len:645 (-) Transcript_18226:957-2891(-)
MADPCSYEHLQQMLDSFFRQDHPPTRHNNVQGDEKPLDKTADTTEETTSSSFMYDPSKSFASWLSSQDYDSGNIAAVPDSPHLLGIDADDDTTYLSEELRHNDGTSPEEMYDGSKSIAEWLSSRDADNVVLTSVSPQRRKAQFEGLMFQSAHGQVGGGNKNMSQYDSNGVCNETNGATSAGMLSNICYGNEVARILSETCGCTIITQLNDLLDTTHCDGDIVDDNNENHYQDEIIGVDEEAVEVPIDNEIHHIRCNSNEEETSATERDDMEEICLNDTFEASLDGGIHNTNDDEETHKSEKDEKDDGLVEEAHVPAVTPEKQLNDGEEASCAPEKEDEQDFPMDETTASAVRPKKSFDRYDSHLDDGARKKLSQMLLDSSLFHHQSNNNEWSSGFESTNDAWRSGCSVDGEDINTVDLESLDDALNNHDEIFREPRAPPSLSQEVHLLGASFAASSVSSDHDTIFERVLYEENRSKQIGHVDVSPLKKVAETRESFLDRTSRREDNHSRRSTISSKEDEPKVVRAQDISRREDDHSRLLSSVGNGERGLKGRTQTYSRREDNHSRRSSLSSREKELEGRTRDNSRREDKHHSRLLSTRSKEEEPKVLKENTIIVMSVRGRKGKDKYARHARKQRLASKVTSLKP